MFLAEVAESTWYLFKATGDPVLLEFGRILVDSIDAIARVPCGFATVREPHIATCDILDCVFICCVCVCVYMCVYVMVLVCTGEQRSHP